MVRGLWAQENSASGDIGGDKMLADSEWVSVSVALVTCVASWKGFKLSVCMCMWCGVYTVTYSQFDQCGI